MSISVVNPISPAVERTQQVLFRPFQAGKWFVLGFCAWVAQLGQAGGGGGGIRLGGGGGPARAPGQRPEPAGMPPQVRQALDWVQANLALVVGIVAVVVLLGVVIGLVLTWVRSRFRFIFLDNVVRNRAEVSQPWHEFRREGNSLFVFEVLLGLATFLAFVAVVGGSVLLAWPDIRAQRFDSAGVVALIVGVSLFVTLGLLLAVVQYILHDFVVPTMYLRRQGVKDSWTVFRKELLAGRVGGLIVYILFRVLMSFVLAVLAIGLTCATCCLAVLPYIGSVILLPISVFDRSYSLYYLEQFGPEWQFFTMAKPTVTDLEFLDG